MADNVISYEKSKETLKKTKLLILLYKFSSRAQKWPKIAKKNGSLNRDLLNFFKGMVYFGYLQMNPHIQAVQNVCGGGRGCFRLS